MKIDTTLALMGAVLALGAAPAYAEKTNYDLTVSFQMTYYQNGQTPRLGIATKDLIYAMTNSQIVTVGIYLYQRGGHEYLDHVEQHVEPGLGLRDHQRSHARHGACFRYPSQAGLSPGGGT